VVHGDVAAREESDPEVKAILNEGGIYRLALAALAVAVIIGGALHNVIPYTPAFPLVVLAASLLSLISALRGGQLAKRLGPSARYVGGFLYVSIVGGGLMLIWSVISAAVGATGSSGGIAGKGGSTLLLNLSWPAAVICLVSIVHAIRVYRNIPR
jgi:hypothetical protein